MAEQISDEEFKSEVVRFIEVANQKFDGLAEGLRTNTFKLDHLENRLGRVEEKVDSIDADLKTLTSDVKVLSGQFSDVGTMAIKDHQRIDGLEKRVDNMESETH